MNLKRCRAQTKNKSLVNSSATYIKLLDYAERLEAQIRDAGIPEELFDGFNVLQNLDDKAKQRTGAENVSDVLDSVVKLIRSKSDNDTDNPLQTEVTELNAIIVNLGTRYKRLLNWIESLVGESNHGIPNLPEYTCLKKSSYQIINEQRELLENEKQNNNNN